RNRQESHNAPRPRLERTSLPSKVLYTRLSPGMPMRVENLRGPALIALPIGAVGAVGLMLSAGHRNGTRMLFLLVLFTGWVLSPFVALAWAHATSKRWSPPPRAALYIVTLIITMATLLIYASVVFG